MKASISEFATCWLSPAQGLPVRRHHHLNACHKQDIPTDLPELDPDAVITGVAAALAGAWLLAIQTRSDEMIACKDHHYDHHKTTGCTHKLIGRLQFLT